MLQKQTEWKIYLKQEMQTEEKRLERQRNREKGTKKRLSRKEVCVGGRQDGRKKGRYANLYTYT